MADIRQSAFSQSQPGSSFVNPICAALALATVPGNTIIAAAASSFDVSANTFTCTDTLGQTYTPIDYLSQSGAYNFATFICANSLSLPAPIAITFTGALSSGATSATLSSAWAGATHTYVIQFSSTDVRAATLTNGSTTVTWGDALHLSATASAQAGFGPILTCNNDSDAVVGMVLEVENVPPSGVLVAHNAAIRNSITNGANTLNPGSLACGSGNGLLVMLVASGSNGAGSPSYTPIVGTSPVSFAQFGSSFVNYGGDIATNAFIWESAHLTAPGTITPTAGSQETASETYYVFGMFLADATVATPPARSLSVSGPGLMPANLANQFRASPLGFIPPISALGGAAASGMASISAALSSFQTAGGLGFVPQPGPGGAGPFNNNQFLSSPRAVIAPGPRFLMTGASRSIASVSATLSQLQSWAAAAGSIASGAAGLTTFVTSGGFIGYQSQPGPGVGPFGNNQFQTPPRSNNVPFQALVASAVSAAIARATAPLNTAILLATDIPGAVALLVEGGSGVGVENGGTLLVASPMRGMATATATLSTGNNLAGAARAIASSASTLTTAAQMSAAASSIVSCSAAPLTGITLAANVTGLSYASAALGSGTTFTVTAAGLAAASGALFTQTLIAAAPTGVGSASAQLSNAPQFAAAASSAANASGAFTASIVLSAQATGLASASSALAGSVILSVSAAGFASAQGTLATSTRLSATAMAAGSVSAVLATSIAPYSAFAFARASASANLNGNVTLAASASSFSQVTARLLTVLQPPGEFADIRWLRAPRGAGVAYAEFFQTVDEQLWYGVNWEDWLASNWEANSAATLNQALRPTIPNGLEFVCTQAGQTGAVEPLWPTFAGGVVVDGTAMWQGQAVSAVSLDDTISSSAFSAPTGIALDSGQILTQRSYLIIDSTTSVVGTDYDVLCTIFTTGGQQKIAKLRIKVR